MRQPGPIQTLSPILSLAVPDTTADELIRTLRPTSAPHHLSSLALSPNARVSGRRAATIRYSQRRNGESLFMSIHLPVRRK